MNHSLPIMSTFLEAISLIYKYYQQLLKAWLPLIVVGTAYGAYTHFNPTDFESRADEIINSAEHISWKEILIDMFSFNTLTIFIFIVFFFAFYTALFMAIVGSHRLFLLGARSIDESKFLSWTGNEFKYMVWSLKITLCIFVFIILGLIILIAIMANFDENWDSGLNIFILIVSLPFFYIISRWSLVLPSTAIGKPIISFSWSWNISAGNGWRLTLLIGLIPYLLSTMFDLLPANDSLFFALFHDLIWVVVSIIEVALLSLSYRYLVVSDFPVPDTNQTSPAIM